MNNMSNRKSVIAWQKYFFMANRTNKNADIFTRFLHLLHTSDCRKLTFKRLESEYTFFTLLGKTHERPQNERWMPLLILRSLMLADKVFPTLSAILAYP